MKNPVKDKKKEDDRRVSRGGFWNYNVGDIPASDRDWHYYDATGEGGGFRMVRSKKNEKSRKMIKRNH